MGRQAAWGQIKQRKGSNELDSFLRRWTPSFVDCKTLKQNFAAIPSMADLGSLQAAVFGNYP